MKTHYQYIYFMRQGTPKRMRTSVWSCRNLRSGAILGIIKWHGAWRQYCFFTKGEIILNRGCMADITEFINQLHEERKTKML